MPPCACAGFTSPYLPGRVFLNLETHGTVTTHISGANCAGCGEGTLCDFHLTCTGSGATSSIDPATCVHTDALGTWNNINDNRSLCLGSVCTLVSPQPPSSGSYSAGSASFCNFGTVSLVYTASGTTVHGTLTDSLTGDCGASGTSQYDIYHVFSNECTP
jgi:hypothetical protein